MKRILIIIAIAAAAAVACNKEVTERPSTDGIRTLSLSAELPDTKVNADKGKITWSAGDAVAVYNTNGTKFTLTLSDGAGTNYGKFSGSFSGTLATDIAVYPASLASDTKGVVSIPKFMERSDSVQPVMASALEVNGSEVNALCFHHVMAMVEVTLKDLPAFACALKLFSKTGAQLNGDYTINSGLNGVNCDTGNSEAGTNDRVLFFPYKTAYGSDASVKFYFPVAPYEYTDLKIRVLDGDESIIEGTDLAIKQASSNLKAGDYLTLPTVNVRAQLGSSRDQFIKVEGVKWAKGNLRVKQEASYEDGWQAGFNLFDYQWQTAYAERDAITVTEALTSDVARSTTFYDLFNWGGLGRSCQYNNSGYITPTTAKFDISGRVFSAREGDKDALDAAEVTGDDRFHYWDVFSGYNGGVSDAENGIGNPTIFGDVAFWASKGQYRMPTSSEIVKLRTNNTAATGQAGYYNTPGGDTVFGVLLTSTPSWSSASMNTTAIELTDADLESGLFLPKAGRRASTETHSKIRYFNNQGVYWSSTFGSLASGHETSSTMLAWRLNYTCDYGYTTNLNGNEWGDVKAGNCIRPVLVD